MPGQSAVDIAALHAAVSAYRRLAVQSSTRTGSRQGTQATGDGVTVPGRTLGDKRARLTALQERVRSTGLAEV